MKLPETADGVHPAAAKARRGGLLREDLHAHPTFSDLERTVLDLPVDDLRAIVLASVDSFQNQAKSPTEYAEWKKWTPPK